MTTNEPGATAAFKNNLHDVSSMLNHLESWVETYARDAGNEAAPTYAAILRDMREALLAAVMITGLDREDVEDVLREQRDDVGDDGNGAVAMVVAELESGCTPAIAGGGTGGGDVAPNHLSPSTETPECPHAP